ERERRELEKALKAGTGGADGATGEVDFDDLLGRATDIAGAAVLAEVVEVPDAKALLVVADRLKAKLDGAIVLGAAVDGRVHLLVSVAPELVARGVKAGTVVKAAAEVVGGGGGGRDTLAQAGGREPEKLGDALAAARATISAALQG
ncbi:MAG: alanyl-tRNA synthetase, partial [Solirubrobacteraceae bacterium]|nr:alanyl-tRNA synthetase [Solirubrobacteraceae bacterium]